MALISLNNLERFFNNLKTYISNALNSKANTTHTHTTADISNLAENWNVTGTNLDISFAGSSNNNGQLSIQINGTNITTFTANQITNSTFNLNFNSFGYNLIPATTNAYDLGTSTYKWKSINGIAPDELGLPARTYTNVSSYITNFDNTPNDFTAPVSGLLYIQGSDSSSFVCAVANDTKGIYINGTYTSGYNRLLVPVEKNDFIRVYIGSCTLSYAKIFHLKGKV